MIDQAIGARKDSKTAYSWLNKKRNAAKKKTVKRVCRVISVDSLGPRWYPIRLIFRQT
jgi:hypothetical protein